MAMRVYRGLAAVNKAEAMVKRTGGSRLGGHPAAALLRARPGPGWWAVSFDGSCHHVGTPAATGGWAYRVEGPDGWALSMGCGPADGKPVSANSAEWQGAAEGLLAAAELADARGTPAGVLVRGDANLVVSQLAGVWTCREPLVRWRAAALDALARLGVPWCAQWRPRVQNDCCDRLSKVASREALRRAAPAA